MTTTIEQLDALLLVRSENEILEFKAAENRFDFEKLVDYCVALANEGGGRMVLGVTNAHPRKVIGTNAFDSPERTVGSIYTRLHLKVIAEEIMHPSGRVLIFHIPPRPTGQPIHHNGRYFMRVGEELLPMSPDQLKKIFAEGLPDWTLQPALDDCNDETIIHLLDTQTYFDRIQQPYPTTRESVLERLCREKAIARTGKSWAITNLGALLFAKNLEDFDLLRRKAPRVIRYDGPSKLNIKTETIGRFGYAVGFQGLLDYIDLLLPANDVIRETLREDVKMFPRAAIRELVANALIHQDFSERGSVMIEIYEDRMEISSPGKPFFPPDRFIDEYQSRNERLADMMRRMKICEEMGSGIDKVIFESEAYQLPAPDFRVNNSRTYAMLFAHREFDDMDRADRIRACYQHCCLRHVVGGRMTNQSLRERFKLQGHKTATVSQIIQATLEVGQIKLAEPAQTSTRYRSYLPYWA